MRDENKIKMINSDESYKIKKLLNKQILGQKIKELILAQYTSMYKFAQYSGFNYDRVKKWAAGKNIPVRNEFCVLSQLLEVPVEYLMNVAIEGRRDYIFSTENEDLSEEIKKQFTIRHKL